MFSSVRTRLILEKMVIVTENKEYSLIQMLWKEEPSPILEILQKLVENIIILPFLGHDDVCILKISNENPKSKQKHQLV